MSRTNRVTHEVVDRIRASLRALPPKIDSDTLSSKEALAALKADIVQARANGYSPIEIVEHMCERGLATSISAVNAGLRVSRIKPPVGKSAAMKPARAQSAPAKAEALRKEAAAPAIDHLEATDSPATERKPSSMDLIRAEAAKRKTAAPVVALPIDDQPESNHI